MQRPDAPAAIVAEPWVRNLRCEAGVVTFSAFAAYPVCERRSRWLAGGTMLCGTCKRRAQREGLIADGYGTTLQSHSASMIVSSGPMTTRIRKA